MDEQRIEAKLEELGLDPKDRGRYWHIHCPLHDDSNKSAVCFKDGWCCCFAGCPRTHINKIARCEVCRPTKVEETTRDVVCDFTELWLDLGPVTEPVKGIPAGVLNKLGWRKWDGDFGVPAGVFIPYFNMDRNRVIFYQVRHNADSERRFSFARGCTPRPYGLECLSLVDKYLVWTEGARDAVILRMCGIPAISIPSASSHAMLGRMYDYAREHGLILVCVGDRDDAGEKLMSSIPGPYIDARTPVGKDVGDFYEQKGLEKVKEYYAKYAVKKTSH